MYSQPRASSAAGSRSGSVNGSANFTTNNSRNVTFGTAGSNQASAMRARPASSGGNGAASRGYLKPTTSSASHAKGGLAKLQRSAEMNDNTTAAPQRALISSGVGYYPDDETNNACGGGITNVGKPPLRADNTNRVGGLTANDISAAAETPTPTYNGSRPQSAQGGLGYGNQHNSAPRTVYRPSAILIDKIHTGQAAPLLPIDALLNTNGGRGGNSNANSPTRSVYGGNGGHFYSLGRPSSSSGARVMGGDTQQHGGFLPSSNAYGGGSVVSRESPDRGYCGTSAYGSGGDFNRTDASNMSALSNASSIPVGAKDLLRFKETLKHQSPSAMAVAAARREMHEDQEKERVAKGEFREQWRKAVESQLEAKSQRRAEERERGKQERTIIEDSYLTEKETNLVKKKQMSREIQRQKYEDEERAAMKAQETVQRSRKERSQLDEQMRRMAQDKQDALIAKRRSQHELLSQATSTQRERLDERLRSDYDRKMVERHQADEAKDAESRERIESRLDQKNRQREVLEQSRALSAIKNLNDSRVQMEYEAALDRQKRNEENREAREAREALDAKHRLANQLKNQMHERQESRMAERKRAIETQRFAADEDRRAAERAIALGKQQKVLRQAELQRELEIQMTNNMSKTLVDLVHH